MECTSQVNILENTNRASFIAEHARVQDTKAAQEVTALKAFYAMLGQDSARAFYGPGHVRAAAELGAIQMLLLSDTLFRVNDVAKVLPLPLAQVPALSTGRNLHVFVT